MPGPVELTMIFAIVLLLFGASELPDLGRSLGRSTKEFELGREKSEQELEELRENN
ncbi:twin-arginine translocase TatA/TatE family subunit [Haloterrigena sp. SYSU A558-1]|uniref:Twin-arginine translocase TatA/TatE family subunit n=1 Tax=Haloterrigena gelatinilytica TaxID=2741724 RepID=A0ABX2LHY4_9EURY|nr:twin-arginine translocase TatA/TatE family subunit [Haloterrigena gelatinilytica]NUC75065.1 twin-arginine translocase TatA/TatE family subunit [Haloterrigena gelatinilytica]